MENVSGLQTYLPSLELLFPSIAAHTSGSPTLAATELVTDLSAGQATIEHLMKREKRQVPAWVRTMHLAEPLEVMSGEYVLPRDGALPTFRTAWQRALHKINNPYNEAYTDAVFACMASRLAETGRSPHWCRFYGTFSGRVPEYRYNITDDLEDIEDEPWFREGLASGAFRIVVVDPANPASSAPFEQPLATVKKQRRLTGSSEEIDSDSVSDANSSISCSSKVGDEKPDAIELIEAEIPLSPGAVEIVAQSRLQLKRVVGSSSSSKGSSSDDEDDDLEYFVVLKDYPVQLTVLERCDGTMDDLMEAEDDDCATPDMKETKEERWTAWIFQVVAALAAAQQTYDFVHNDLHTNNVMWCGTGETHLYYHIQGAAGGDRFYKVPTYGRIFKIIDFGRATFRPPATTKENNRVWFPDAFAPGADAGGQYNCGPYFEQGKPKVQPNRSFDLCRLAVAILDTLWDEPPEPVSPRKVLTREPGRAQPETVSPLWNTMWLWLTDDNGKNVLRGPDDNERYPEFDLYCAISRDIHNAVPAQQLTLPLFDVSFRTRKKDLPTDATVWKLQSTK
jgi:hypothetical protein